jgi:hypothetical protein
MKVFLVVWLIVGGQDIGGPPVEVPSMKECEGRAARIRALDIPENATVLRVGCVTEKRRGDPV